jgi:hypothetical protein
MIYLHSKNYSILNEKIIIKKIDTYFVLVLLMYVLSELRFNNFVAQIFLKLCKLALIFLYLFSTIIPLH